MTSRLEPHHRLVPLISHRAADIGARANPSGRTVDDEDMVARVRAHMARMGVTRVANVTGLDRIGIPVVMVVRPNARSLSVSQGKGIDPAAATISGLMEATELYHAEHIEAPLKLGSQAEMESSHTFLDVGRLARVSGREWSRNLAMLWIEGLDLLSGEPRWTPFESVRANFTLPPPPGSGCFDCSSNGLASGRTMAEAVRHAICEIIERDSTALWNRLSPHRRAATGVRLDDVGDEPCRQVLDRLERADFDVAAWETTSDVGIPAFFGLIRDRRNPEGHHGVGAASDPAPAIALRRALVEAVQVRMTYISGTRDDLAPRDYQQGLSETRRTADRLLSAYAPLKEFRDIRDWSGKDAAEDVASLLSRLSAAGIEEVVAIDLGKDDIGIPVVRVVIPGLEGPDDHDGYVPGKRAAALAGAEP